MHLYIVMLIHLQKSLDLLPFVTILRFLVTLLSYSVGIISNYSPHYKNLSIMRVMFHIGFFFQDEAYSGMVRVRYLDDITEYHVRIMNSKLDSTLFNYHVFEESDGRLIQKENVAKHLRTQTLHCAVFEALQQWLNANQLIIAPSERTSHRWRAN